MKQKRKNIRFFAGKITDRWYLLQQRLSHLRVNLQMALEVSVGALQNTCPTWWYCSGRGAQCDPINICDSRHLLIGIPKETSNNSSVNININSSSSGNNIRIFNPIYDYQQLRRAPPISTLSNPKLYTLTHNNFS